MKKSRTGSSVGEALASPPVATVQLPLPLLDVLADTRTAFFGLCLDAGQQVLRAMMEQERERLCGPKNVPNPNRRAYSGGSVRGEVTLGGRRILVPRLRARSLAGHELALPSFAYAAGRDPLDAHPRDGGSGHPRGCEAVLTRVRVAREEGMKAEDCILFSGGATGTEAAFGAAAERHGVDEVNFTFEGHDPVRQRGRRILTNAELRRGDVSLGYISKLMHRKFPDTPLFRHVLQTIWHQVQSGHEIFLIGRINPDDTVTGGTGIAAEYAKVFNKPLYVFDQERDGWSRWTGEGWRAETSPVIRQPYFCGSGTRFLKPNGQAAVDTLFARTFG